MRYCYLSLNAKHPWRTSKNLSCTEQIYRVILAEQTAKIGPVHDNFSPVSLA